MNRIRSDMWHVDRRSKVALDDLTFFSEEQGDAAHALSGVFRQAYAEPIRINEEARDGLELYATHRYPAQRSASHDSVGTKPIDLLCENILQENFWQDEKSNVPLV